MGFKDFEPCYGCWYWVLASRLFGLGSGLFLLRLRRRNTNPRQSSLGSGLACCGWSQYILEVQIPQQLGVLIGQLGAQGLDLGLDLGVFFQAALEEPVGQVELYLYADSCRGQAPFNYSDYNGFGGGAGSIWQNSI